VPFDFCFGQFLQQTKSLLTSAPHAAQHQPACMLSPCGHAASAAWLTLLLNPSTDLLALSQSLICNICNQVSYLELLLLPLLLLLL
jgi:hypothetical protein